MTLRRTLLAAVVSAAVSPAAAAPLAGVPDSFATEGLMPVLTLQGIGAQIYECKAKAGGTRAWTFREPIASLLENGETVGRHYKGPNWDLSDGGVTGKVEASAPGATPDDIPALKLRVTDHRGAGRLKDVQVVLRLDPVGGVLTGACDRDGDLRSVPYRADYVFLK